jgi:hypothetical protein
MCINQSAARGGENHMKAMLVLVAALIVAPIADVSAAAPSAISITAKKKSAGSRSGGNIGQVKNVKRTQDDIYYEFNLRTMSPQTPSPVTVKWVVLVSTVRGALREASKGKETIELVTAKPAVVETPIFTLHEQEGPKGANFEAEIFGVGVRVFGPDGAQLAEYLQPEKHRKQIQSAF